MRLALVSAFGSAACLPACEDESHCGTSEAVCIYLASADGGFNSPALFADVELAVTFGGVTLSQWDGHQDDDAGLCFDGSTYTDPATDQSYSARRCCTKHNDAGVYDVSVTKGGQSLLSERVTVAKDPNNACNVKTVELLVRVPE